MKRVQKRGKSFLSPSSASNKKNRLSNLKHREEEDGENSSLSSDVEEEEQLMKITGKLHNSFETLSQKRGNFELEEESKLIYSNETPEEKRLRLAQQYLENFKRTTAIDKEFDSEEDEDSDDNLSKSLREHVLELKGKQIKELAAKLEGKQVDVEKVRILKGHQHTVTCLALAEDDSVVYSGGKDCIINQWDIETGKRLLTFPSKDNPLSAPTNKTDVKNILKETHRGQILALALSSDRRFLASSGRDSNHYICIWDARSGKLIDQFKGHRDSVSALSFRRGSNQLFSGSHDRTIKIWNVDEMSYIDTLYGHQSEITCLDSLHKESAISSGTDKSIHFWKVIDETQLIFRGHTASIDCVSLIHEQSFVSGSEDGSIALWSLKKKKPVCIVKNAHPLATGNGFENIESNIAGWIASISSIKNSDLVASGSSDGFIRLWKLNESVGGITPVLNIPMNGFVNALAFSHKPRFLIAGIGQEHRLGRWSTVKEARNGLRIIPLPFSS